MMPQHTIRKIGLLFLQGQEILLVRKKNTNKLILPGGKPEHNEDDVSCLARELDEELGVQLIPESLEEFGNFSGPSANELAGLELIVYLGKFVGNPRPQSEIEEMLWVRVDGEVDSLSPLLKTAVMPKLRKLISDGRIKG